MDLPDFPVDDVTLDLVWSALHPELLDSSIQVTSLLSLLDFLSTMEGTDTAEIDYTVCIDGNDIDVMKNSSYSEHDVIKALIIEIRRLRKNEK